MSLTKYGDITLPYCDITQFRQEVVLDDLSGTDFILEKFDIQVQTVLNQNYLAQLVPPSVTSALANNPAEIMNFVRKQLLRPQQRLSVTFNGVELIPRIAANTSSIDARNGPFPQSCVLTQMTNETFLLTWHVVAHYWENINLSSTSTPLFANRQGAPVLYNRWTETVSIDNCNYTRRIRSGKYMIRSDNSQKKIADAYRSQLAVVGVPPGFNRVSSEYTVSPDGLAIQYTVIDQEVFNNPPFPANVAEGDYVESTTRNGSMRWGAVRVKLRASKTTDRSFLIQRCVQVAAAKALLQEALTGAAGGTSLRFGRLEQAMVRVNLYDNEVECSLRVMLRAEQGRTAGIGMDLNRLIRTPGSEQGTNAPPLYFDRGSASVLLQAAAYYDPSVGAKLADGESATADNPARITGDRTQHDVGLRPGQAG